MIRIFEDAIRGGVTSVNNNHVDAYIPELNNNHDGNIHLAYFDENNFMGHVYVGHCLILSLLGYQIRSFNTLPKPRRNPQLK